MFKLLFICLILISQCSVFSQISEEINPPNFIKTIIFNSKDEIDQFPIIKLNEPLFLSFDDLRGSDQDFYYKISYFNHDWSPSGLFKNDFITGFDNQRISNFKSSFGTKQSYTHYELELPNEKTKFLLTGNYMIEIYDQNDIVVFSRKFLIFSNNAIVNSAITSSLDLKKFTTHQAIKFNVKPLNISFQNPQNDIKVVILQNYQWDFSIQNIKPQFIINQELQFYQDLELLFEGGNEYYFFDTKDILAESQNISFVSNETQYQTYLHTNVERNLYPYSNTQDINGDFRVRTLSGFDNKTEADYTQVHFSLSKNKIFEDENIYVYGKFNNYSLSDENIMIFNPGLEIYESDITLKQGFYNYKYVSKIGENVLKKNKISGSHYNSENTFQIFIYYRPIGNINDQLIGVSKPNSFKLSTSINFENY